MVNSDSLYSILRFIPNSSNRIEQMKVLNLSIKEYYKSAILLFGSRDENKQSKNNKNVIPRTLHVLQILPCGCSDNHCLNTTHSVQTYNYAANDFVKTNSTNWGLSTL